MGLAINTMPLERRENIYVEDIIESRAKAEDIEYATYLLTSNLDTLFDVSFS